MDQKSRFCQSCWTPLEESVDRCPICFEQVPVDDLDRGAEPLQDHLRSATGDDDQLMPARRGGTDRFSKMAAAAALILLVAAGWATLSADTFFKSVETGRPKQPDRGPETRPEEERPGAQSGPVAMADFAGRWVVTDAPDAWDAEGVEFELVHDKDSIVAPESAPGDFKLELRAKLPGQMEGSIRAGRMTVPVSAWLSDDRSILTLILTPPMGPPFRIKAGRRSLPEG